MEADVIIVAGIMFDAPPPGSITSNCQAVECQAEIVLGPNQQRVIAEHEGGERQVIRMCMPCVISLQIKTGGQVFDTVQQAENYPSKN